MKAKTKAETVIELFTSVLTHGENGNYLNLHAKSTQTSTSRPQTLQLVASQIEKCEQTQKSQL